MLRKFAARAGLNVRATKLDTTIAKLKAIAVSLKSVPVIPERKIKGAKDATSTKVVEIIGAVMLLAPSHAATKGV